MSQLFASGGQRIGISASALVLPMNIQGSSSNCCFLSCIQVSKEAGNVVWCSHLIKNIPQFVVIHIVKGFSMLIEAEVDDFLGTPLLFL